MLDISALQADHAALTAIVAQFSPVLQANTDIAGRAVAVVEQLLAQIGGAGPTQADIDALHASATAALTTLQADVTAVNATNAALQTEIGKVAPPVTQVGIVRLLLMKGGMARLSKAGDRDGSVSRTM